MTFRLSDRQTGSNPCGRVNPVTRTFCSLFRFQTDPLPLWVHLSVASPVGLAAAGKTEPSLIFLYSGHFNAVKEMPESPTEPAPCYLRMNCHGLCWGNDVGDGRVSGDPDAAKDWSNHSGTASCVS